jgi:hypothetical protein
MRFWHNLREIIPILNPYPLMIALGLGRAAMGSGKKIQRP